MRRLLAQPEAEAPTLCRAYLLNGLGMLDHMHSPEARERFTESLDLFRTFGDRYGEAWVLSHLGQVAIYSREYVQARECFEKSLALFGELGADWNMAWVLYNLSELGMETGKEYLPYLKESLALFQKAEDTRATSLCHYSFGAIARDQGHLAAALDSFGESLRLIRQVGDPVVTARTSFAIGDVLQRMGDFQQAKPYLLDSLRVYRQKGELWGVAFCLIDLARNAVREHDATEAASMLGAASVLLEGEPDYFQSSGRGFYAPAKADVRARLEEPAFSQAWQAGRASVETVLKSMDAWSG